MRQTRDELLIWELGKIANVAVSLFSDRDILINRVKNNYGKRIKS
jgi:hypothetical protein